MTSFSVTQSRWQITHFWKFVIGGLLLSQWYLSTVSRGTLVYTGMTITQHSQKLQRRTCTVSRITSLCLQDILLQRRTLHLFTKRPSLMLANIAHPKFNRKGESCWEEVVVLSGRNDVVGDTDVSRLVTTLRAWLPRQSDSSPLI